MPASQSHHEWSAVTNFFTRCLFLAGILSMLLVQSLHAKPGDLDTTFGENGFSIIPAPGTSTTSIESGNAVAVQPDGKVLIVGTADNEIAMLRLNATNCTPDSSFGSNGKVTTGFSASDVANAVALLPNGKFIVAGNTLSGSGETVFLVARFQTNGDLDTTFGTNGSTQIGFGNTNGFNQARALTIQPDGKIIVVGQADNIISTNIGSADFGVVRLNADGSLDSTFGTGGNAVVLQTDGKILVAGEATVTNDLGVVTNMQGVVTNVLVLQSRFGVARYLTNGLLDTAFGTEGLVNFQYGDSGTADIAYGIALQSNGKIIVAGADNGYYFTNSTGGFMVARLNTDGSMDTTFGYINGVNDFYFVGSIQNNARALLVFSDDTISLIGSAQLSGQGLNYAKMTFSPGGILIALARYSANFSATNYNEEGLAAAILPNNNVVIIGQTMQNDAGDIGVVILNSGQNGTTNVPVLGTTTIENGYAVAVQHDGKAIIVGSADYELAVLRLNADGTKDTTFGLGGKVAANFADFTGGSAVAILPDGRFIVAGTTIAANGTGMFLIARYLTNGVLDTTFGTSGSTKIDFGNAVTNIFNYSLANALAIQPDGKIIVVGNVFVEGVADDLGVVRLNADGSLDSTFGTSGKVITNLGDSAAFANAVALQSDGKILVAEEVDDVVSNSVFGVTRYLTNGLPDPTFGTDGSVTINYGDRNSAAYGIALQSSGKIIVGGDLEDTDINGVEGGFMVARLNTNGSLDTAFGSDNGVKTSTPVGSVQCSARALLVFSDDSIKLVGSQQLSGHGLNYAEASFSANGTLVSIIPYSANFSATNYNEQGLAAAILPNNNVLIVGQTEQNDAGDIGVVGLNGVQSFGQFPPSSNNVQSFGQFAKPAQAFATDVAVQADGKIVSSGYSGLGSGPYSMLISRLNGDGTRDTTFGNGGLVSVSPNGMGVGEALSIQSDGKIVAAGASINPITSAQQFLLARFTITGALDPTFGTGGIGAYNSASGSFADFLVVRIQPDGKIVAAGSAYAGSSMVIGRFLTNGTPDSTFGSGGFVNIPIGTGPSIAYDLQLLQNGRIIVAGYAGVSSGEDIGMAQVNSNGSLDTTFGVGGIKTIHAGDPYEEGFALAVQSDGKLVICGQSQDSTGNLYALILRCQTNGVLDPTFGVGGIIKTNFGATNMIARSVQIQTDGRIVIGGYYGRSGAADDFAVFRLLTNGVPDPTFGTNGVAHTTPPGTYPDSGIIYGMEIQTNGSIIAAGEVITVAGQTIALARYLGGPGPPIVTVPSNIIAEATSASGAGVNFTTSATNSSGAVTTINLPPSGSTFSLGLTAVTVTATDINGTATNTFTVTVQDTTPPVITVPANIVAEATSASGAAVAFNVSATDLVSGAVQVTGSWGNGGLTFPLGVTTVTERATDAAGNSATNSFTVTVQDTTPPAITLLGGNTLTNYINTIFTDPGATATDLVAGNLTSAIVVTGTVNTNVLGSNVLTYTVSDTYGNTAVTNRTVVIQIAPPPPLLTIALQYGTYFTPSYGLFTMASTQHVDLNPESLIAMDVNGDGKLDLISANYNAATLTVSTNSGNGNFVFSSRASGAGHPASITAADVNGDGSQDLICPNYAGVGSSVLVFTNNGSGGFVRAGIYAVGLDPHSVAAADVNGDGTVDVISANSGDNTLSVLTNDGGGFVLAGTYAVGIQPYVVIAVDVNGDGYVDLVSANMGTNTLSILTNNGSGGFALASSPVVGNEPRSVTATDVNGDGKVDLISADTGGLSGNTLTVLTNNGSGIFGPNATLTVGAAPYWVTAADVNGDGKVDLISANFSDFTLTVLTNNGNGSFGSNATYAVSAHPYSVIAADVNGDGQADLISANFTGSTLSVLTNAPTGLTTNIGNIAVISWRSPYTGFVLQQKSNLATTNWTTSSLLINDNGTTKSASNAPPVGNLFFRLTHP
jgi:uncharacterized delta-60 repeat protein